MRKLPILVTATIAATVGSVTVVFASPRSGVLSWKDHVRAHAADTSTMTVVAAAPLAPSSAGADVPGAEPPRSPKDTPCTADYYVTLDPGFSNTPSSGTFTTGGETGTWACDGTADGKKITGVGTWGEEGRYGTTGPNSCTKLDGELVQTTAITMPTASAPVHIITPLRGTYGPLQGGGLVGGTFEGPRLYGSFTAMPAEGDCVTKPATKFHIHLKGWLVEGR